MTDREPNRLEGAFYEYMHLLGQSSPDWNRDVLEFYVPLLADCQTVLDVGCGEGQLLELLQAAGVNAVGIDLDDRMVEVCQERGLNVERADLFDYLPRHEGQFDGIFCSNLIEHLPARDAVQFLQAAFGALSSGGLLLVTTPNPESLIVHLYEFWRDATHVRLYSPSLLEFLFDWAGFAEIESGENPRTAWTSPLEMQQVPQLLESLSSRPRLMPWDPGPPDAPLPGSRKDSTALRRVIPTLRRRLGRWLAQTIMFEEFAALHGRFAALYEHFAVLNVALSDSHRIERALYETQNVLLSRPREVFVVGYKPPAQAEGSQ